MLNSGSFRDPSGFVFTKDNQIFRAVTFYYKENFDFFINSGLYGELISKGLLIPHDEVDLKDFDYPNLYKVLKPEKVQFISYPYEWCFSQLKDAALTTLKIQETALNYNMSLKDASAYNMQFVNGKPVFIDTLSFEIYKEGKPWVAYSQFCKHFLAPLSLIAYKNLELGKLLKEYIDGIPLNLTSSLLPFSKKSHFGLFMHIVMHAKAQKKFKAANIKENNKRISKNSSIGLNRSLKSTVSSIKLKHTGTTWNEYYENDTHSDIYFEDKKRLVAEFLDIANPSGVLDLGANTGLFTRLAAKKNINVISTDFDAMCVEKNYLLVKENHEKNILPLILDLTNPSPAIGWANLERQSFFNRGPFDMVMALALIHHLAIANNIPLQNIAEFFSKICNWLIIEFIPKDDPKVQVLLNSREDIFVNYTEEKFEEAFIKYFKIVKNKLLIGNRIVFLMKNLK
jgi:2-polyprenyl-3-methyl-5-hydroxy-6-metoxy-1,4-benzoquinol methylase